MVGTLAVDGWAVTFGTVRMELGEVAARPGPPGCTKCNSTPSNGQYTKFVLFDVALLPLEFKGLRLLLRVYTDTMRHLLLKLLVMIRACAEHDTLHP